MELVVVVVREAGKLLHTHKQAQELINNREPRDELQVSWTGLRTHLWAFNRLACTRKPTYGLYVELG